MGLYAFNVTVKLENDKTKECYLFSDAESAKEGREKMEALINKRIANAKNGDMMFRNCKEHYHEWKSFFITRVGDENSRRSGLSFGHYLRH